ncbi:MAG: cryptochrome/photolyase family protein [Planctomycetota bacterium]|jgi:deoxyribodipyrimidine photolyase-related protein
MRFSDALSRFGRSADRWAYIAYDQLSDRIGPLATGGYGIILIENPDKARRRPYHKQKLAFILANQRHFALEQAERGVAVRYEVGPYADTLRRLAAELGPITTMEPAERELAVELAPLVDEGLLRIVPHDGWLTTREDLGEAPWRMDAFYRRVRRRTGLLMEDGKPEGGRWSFDAENRKPWKGSPRPPRLPTFRPDAITMEVCALVEREFGDHPGRLDPTTLPATAQDACRQFDWAMAECLPLFGPYEDAMAREERTLFHTRLSPLLNTHRVLPRDVVEAVAASDAPLASREGLLRQVIGWREFVRWVHRETDGLRSIPHDVLGTRSPLPPAYWGERSGLACLDEVVASVWDEGYSHHITRLMILCNIGLLLDVDARAMSDWFRIAYVDAFDWVVEPNVLGMGMYATGDLMTTKPYVSGANYINKMSDYCGSCAFDPKRTCPLTRMYWAFLDRHESALAGNPRMALPLRSLQKRDREEDRRIAEEVRQTLAGGESL